MRVRVRKGAVAPRVMAGSDASTTGLHRMSSRAWRQESRCVAFSYALRHRGFVGRGGLDVKTTGAVSASEIELCSRAAGTCLN